MQGLKTAEVMRRSLRAKVCTICRFRPPGSEALPPTEPRECETSCPIFANLPALRKIARDLSDDPRAHFEHAIEDGVCLGCKLSDTAGDYCNQRLTRDCPLSCYASLVLETLEPLVVERWRRSRGKVTN